MFVSFKRKPGKTAVSIKTILEFYSIQLQFYNGCFYFSFSLEIWAVWGATEAVKR